MRKAVVNSTPLIALAKADKLALLRDLYDLVIIPEAVYRTLLPIIFDIYWGLGVLISTCASICGATSP